jgi:hypothetical protein
MNLAATVGAEPVSSGFLNRNMKLEMNKLLGKDVERQAIEILRRRTFRGAGYSEKDIQWAVEVIRRQDPNHPLLRYSERGPIKSDTTE